MKKIIPVFVGLLLVGCASIPTGLTLTQRGPAPDIKTAIEVAHASLKRSLKDYDSMKDFAVVGEIRPITATNFANNFEEAWMLCVEYNAKNSYGAYVGLKEHGFPLRVENGRAVVVSSINWLTYANDRCN